MDMFSQLSKIDFDKSIVRQIFVMEKEEYCSADSICNWLIMQDADWWDHWQLEDALEVHKEMWRRQHLHIKDQSDPLYLVEHMIDLLRDKQQ